MSSLDGLDEIMCNNECKKRGRYKTKDPRLKYSNLHVDLASDRCVCNICGKSLKALQYFRRHVCLPKGLDKEMVMNREKSYCCHECGKLFSSLSGFKVHQTKHETMVTSQMCDLCSKHFVDDVSLKRHKQLKHWKPKHLRCHCLMCGFSTTNLQYLKSHLKSHLGTRPYGCQVCDKWFEWRSYLRDHVKAVHQNMCPYSCEICGKQFKRKISLNEHSKTEHTGERPFSCSNCPKAFVRASSLRDHMNSHLLVSKPKKQYSCELCNNRSFLDKTCLAVHRASAHSDEKPYICDVCGKSFKLKNGLKAHCQTHSDDRPYDCQLCDSSFKFKKDLRKHQERHKSSKDYLCDICGKGFVTRNDVYLHQKVHDPSKSHRIYKPGKYKVSGGELLTARTRKNKLSLKEQEPISFDTEINGNGNIKFKNNFQEKESHKSCMGAFADVANNLLSLSVGNEALSSQSLSFETFFDNSGDSEKFLGLTKLEEAGEAESSLNLSNSNGSSRDCPATPSRHQLETHDRWNSAELLEDFDWLDATSSQADAEDKSSSPVECPVPVDHVPGNLSDDTLTPAQEEANLQHSGDSQSVDAMQSFTSNPQELPDFDSHENVVDVQEEQSGTFCESDVDLQSLNEYLNEELNNSQSLSDVQMNGFNARLHSAEYESPTSVDMHESNSSLGDSLNEAQDGLNKQDLSFTNVDTNELQIIGHGKLDSIFTPKNDEIGFYEGNVAELVRSDLTAMLRTDATVLSSASSQQDQDGKRKEKQLLIDFQMTSCDMFNDTSDIFEENSGLDARPVTCCTPENDNSQNAVSYPGDEPSSDVSHITWGNTEDQRSIDKESECQQDAAKKEETGHFDIDPTPIKQNERFKVLEVVSAHNESAHRIMLPRQQKQLTDLEFKHPASAMTLNTRDGWKKHKQYYKTSSSNENKRFKCDDCGRSYTTQSNLNTHLSACHAGYSKSMICHLCGYICNDKQNFGRHLVRHSSARPFKCDTCQKSFKTREAVKTHLNRHLPSKMLHRCDQCHQFYNHFNSLQAHKQTHLFVAPSFACSICGKQLSDRSNLTAHKKRHLVPRKYTCPVCFKELSSLHSLQSHQGIACIKYQLKKLKAREKNESHLRRKRAQEERKIIKEKRKEVKQNKSCCPVCLKQFEAPWKLMMHMAVHSSARPFLCDLCGKSFKRASTAKIHKKLAHAQKLG